MGKFVIFYAKKVLDENDDVQIWNPYLFFDSFDNSKKFYCRRFNNRFFSLVDSRRKRYLYEIRTIYCEEENFEKKLFENVVVIDENNVNEIFCFLY